MVPCRGMGRFEERASCLHGERPRGQREGSSFLWKRQEKEPDTGRAVGRNVSPQPSSPMHGKSSWSLSAEGSAPKCGAVV